MKKILFSAAAALLLCCCTYKEKTGNPSVIMVEDFEILDVESKVLSKHYVGQAEENYSTTLSFQTGGHVADVMVGEGEAVSKGTLLAVLDKTNSINAYNAAKSTLKQAEDGYRRLKEVYDKGSLAEVKWVEMQTKLEQAKAMEATARKSLEDCELYAPFDGIAGKRTAEKGMNMLPSQPVMDLLDISTVKIRIPVPENEIAGISKGMEAIVCIAALGDTLYRGTVTEKGVTADRLSHSYPVKIEVENKGLEIMPGMVCKVYLKCKDGSDGFCVPAQAIQTDKQGRYVWINDNGVAKRRRVETGGFNANGIRVKNGLEKGDRVIVSGFLKLSEDSRVERIVK